MRRLKRYSTFNTFEQNIQTNKETLLNLINNSDNRLQPDKAILYSDDSIFGGVYCETNSTANEGILYAVEFIGYNNIDINKESKTCIGAVATRIMYEKNDGNYSFSLDENSRYVSIFQYTSSLSSAINSLKNLVTFEGLSLRYLGSNFKDAITKLEKMHWLFACSFRIRQC